ncbi:hypothetical protein JCM3765_000646 [Sporobolomyces pararoseus]
MRRFPPPPGGSTTSASTTPLNALNNASSGNRSSEAPMQYEWEKPRQFPTSLFSTPQRASGHEDGERARKRTHYEAMDVDTPPTQSYTQRQQSDIKLEPLSFDPKKDFDRREALGLNDQQSIEEVVMADTAEELVEDVNDKGNHQELVVSTVRRRNLNSKSANNKRSTQVTVETDDEDAEEGEEGTIGEEEGLLGTLQRKIGKKIGNKGGGSEFSFQVHHHHAPPPTSHGGPSNTPHTPERWLQSNTPYVLLGYLQFGSLTLFALLVLSLLFLFLYTLYTDIQSRLGSLTLELRQEILQCAKAYVDNRCEPSTRIPAMERKCSDWEECMNREVIVTGKTRVVAETLAEIVNGFVDVISFKTMLFVLLTLGITIYGSSAALALLSSRAATNHHHQQYSQSIPAHFYPPPYGLPYAAGQTPWVIETGGGGHGQLGGGSGMLDEKEGRMKKVS